MSPIEFLYPGGVAMTRAEYLSNSAKLFSINGIILFIANAFIFAGRFNADLGAYGTKLSNYTFYIVAVLSFLALNGEGIGYKRHRDFVNKKRIKALKFVLAFAFLIRFIKRSVEAFILGIGGSGASRVCAKIFLGFFNTFATYSFLFTLVSLLYLVRDKREKKVFVFEIAAFSSGVLYAVYRSLFYSVTKYELMEFGSVFAKLFSNTSVMYILGLMEYMMFVVMCFVVIHCYNKKVLYEQDEKIKERKKMLVAPKIYNTDHLGLDTLEDDFLLPGEEK